MTLFELRMLRAALKQSLKDQGHLLSEKELDKIFDQINILDQVIEKLETKQ